MNEKGKFIVYEGIGGCGKGTHLKLTQEYFELMGKTIYTTQEHTRNTPLGILIERIIKGKEDPIDPVALQLMFVADRANHTAKEIVPALRRFDFVLSDRYEASTFSYAPPENRDYFMVVNRGVTIPPDLTLIIDLDPKEAVRRINGRNDADIFDKVEVLKKCRESYRWYFDNSGWPCAWIDGSGTREEVFGRIINEFKRRKVI